MKTLLLSLICSFSALSQTQYDFMGGITLNLNTGSGQCFYFDIENDLHHDLRFVYGQGTISVHAQYSDSVFFPVSNNMWIDCKDAGKYSGGSAGLINPTNSLSIGNHVLPFYKSGNYGYFVINVFVDKVIIRGHLMNGGNFNEFQCFDLRENPPIIRDSLFIEYDTMGNPNPGSGLIIRKYEDGTITKYFRP